MILRLAANTAIHTAGGIAMGITLTLAACTVAQVAKRGAETIGGMGKPGPSPQPPASPPAGPPPV